MDNVPTTTCHILKGWVENDLAVGHPIQIRSLLSIRNKIKLLLTASYQNMLEGSCKIKLGCLEQKSLKQWFLNFRGCQPHLAPRGPGSLKQHRAWAFVFLPSTLGGSVSHQSLGTMILK